MILQHYKARLFMDDLYNENARVTMTKKEKKKSYKNYNRPTLLGKAFRA